MRKDEIMMISAMDGGEYIMLIGVSQKGKISYQVISLICGIKGINARNMKKRNKLLDTVSTIVI